MRQHYTIHVTANIQHWVYRTGFMGIFFPYFQKQKLMSKLQDPKFLKCKVIHTVEADHGASMGLLETVTIPSFSHILCYRVSGTCVGLPSPNQLHCVSNGEWDCTKIEGNDEEGETNTRQFCHWWQKKQHHNQSPIFIFAMGPPLFHVRHGWNGSFWMKVLQRGRGMQSDFDAEFSGIICSQFHVKIPCMNSTDQTLTNCVGTHKGNGNTQLLIYT